VINQPRWPVFTSGSGLLLTGFEPPAGFTPFAVSLSSRLGYSATRFSRLPATRPRTIVHPMKIGIGSDHAGFEYKEQIRHLLQELGHTVTDFGTDSAQPVDYPLFIRPVAQAVARGDCERGIVLGGSGNGEAIVANRVRGIRCALCWNLESAKLGRQHNDANMISLGQRMISVDLARQIVRTWLDTPFEGGRHQRRIDLIDP
jgi:ribose 5-phosphate isomerase B